MTALCQQGPLIGKKMISLISLILFFGITPIFFLNRDFWDLKIYRILFFRRLIGKNRRLLSQ